MNFRKIGQRLALARKESNLTQEEAIQKLDLDYGFKIDIKTLRRYEHGDAVNLERLMKLAELYNKTLDYIVYGYNTTRDDSMRWEDMLKRLSILICSGVLLPQKCDVGVMGKETYVLYAFDEETNCFLDKANVLCKIKNYNNKKGRPDFDHLLEDINDEILQIVNKDDEVELTLERIMDFFHKCGQDPTAFIKEKVEIALKNKKLQQEKSASENTKAPFESNN
nr:helix-turn-helix domain-containing protein [Clostridia bacterium]